MLNSLIEVTAGKRRLYSDIQSSDGSHMLNLSSSARSPPLMLLFHAAFSLFSINAISCRNTLLSEASTFVD